MACDNCTKLGYAHRDLNANHISLDDPTAFYSITYLLYKSAADFAGSTSLNGSTPVPSANVFVPL